MYSSPDSKVHGAIMGPIWGRQDPGGPHVGPINFAIWETTAATMMTLLFATRVGIQSTTSVVLHHGRNMVMTFIECYPQPHITQ